MKKKITHYDHTGQPCYEILSDPLRDTLEEIVEYHSNYVWGLEAGIKKLRIVLDIVLPHYVKFESNNIDSKEVVETKLKKALAILETMK